MATKKRMWAEVLAMLNCQECANKAEMLIIRYESDVKRCCPVYVYLEELLRQEQAEMSKETNTEVRT